MPFNSIVFSITCEITENRCGNKGRFYPLPVIFPNFWNVAPLFLNSAVRGDFGRLFIFDFDFQNVNH
jgi:hypothetical protein|uniref:Uncharacterized protein n=1 Tax=Siphoviridae sp. ctSOk3 TaxID=2826342 RepID=A0A8S5NBC5_9CAUD|nr:MAG TPA: hypothetical protein [Siphoviridae sp. ctSOk3]